MTTMIIWGSALLVYAVFYSWYIGFKRKVEPQEVQEIVDLASAEGVAEGQIEILRKFLLSDDGKDFVMVNLLLLAQPVAASSKKLEQYQKIFLGALLRKAGHPVLVAWVAGGNIENLACDHHEGWGAAGMIRYRSRRDFMDMLPSTIGSEHHHLKLEALERTFAFPASPWFLFGGPKLLAPLCIALLAALVQLCI